MKYIEVSDAIETAWMILSGLGYLKEENPQLEQTVREVFATAPSADGKRMDKRETTTFQGKCASCRFFKPEYDGAKCGYCSGRMNRKGRIMRTYKCIGYEAVPTIIDETDD